MTFSSFQIGVDIATSLAIAASAGMFLWNQRRALKEAKRRQLDESVRSVAVEEFQGVLGSLSGVYVHQVVTGSMRLENAVARGVSFLEKRLEANSGLSEKLLESVEKTRSAICDFYESVNIYRYQVYPLLDSIEGGDEQLARFKDRLKALGTSYNQIGIGYSSLIKEVRELAEFCSNNDFESADKGVLFSKAQSILTDTDYRSWVDSFIPEDLEDTYWQCVSEGSFDEAPDLWGRVLTNFIQHFYAKKFLMEAQVFDMAHTQIVRTRKQCKEFLVTMAAINYWLIRKSGKDETLEQVIERYGSDAFFALRNEIR